MAGDDLWRADTQGGRRRPEVGLLFTWTEGVASIDYESSHLKGCGAYAAGPAALDGHGNIPDAGRLVIELRTEPFQPLFLAGFLHPGRRAVCSRT